MLLKSNKHKKRCGHVELQIDDRVEDVGRNVNIFVEGCC